MRPCRAIQESALQDGANRRHALVGEVGLARTRLGTMEHQLTRAALESAVIRTCAPTLLSAKPASLFTFTGPFAERCDACPDEASPCQAQESARADAAGMTIARRRRRLWRLVDALNRSLQPQGLRIQILAWRPFGAVVYVWRPALLVCHMADPRIVRVLAALGYRTARAFVELGKDMNDRTCGMFITELCARFASGGVPHEIGFFLGYPFEDVQGFVEHEGRDFVCFGCWKVYANARHALRCFSQFKRCTRRCRGLAARGMTLEEILAAHDFARAA